jgi:MoxR-like ATPase
MEKITITCAACGTHEGHYLGDHLKEVHGLTVEAYQAKYGVPAWSDALANKRGTVRRQAAPDLNNLTLKFSAIQGKVHPDVPASACLPMPEAYTVPQHGKLGRDIESACFSLARQRSMYIHGLPGSGKDALFHAWSHLTRTPALIFTIQPGEDVQGWFYTRSFDQSGTRWEEGELLRALRDGYTSPTTGRVIPYLILISDFDRADRSQAEALRLVMDSIAGRVKGPAGVTYPVLAGTQIVATANSAGSGDTRGRCISSNPIDASILDRFERKCQFHWMDWEDEVKVAKAKYPLLVEKCPDIFPQVGAATAAIRKGIENNELYAEFSHRALCSWLSLAEDIVVGTGAVPSSLLKRASRAFLDGMPDDEAIAVCKRLMDPHLKGGAVDEGDTSHIGKGNLGR